MSDPAFHRDGPGKSPTAFLIAGTVVVAAIIVANAWPKPSDAPPSLRSPVLPPPVEVEEEEVARFAPSAAFLQPEEFAELERAEKSINRNQGKSRTDLETVVFGIVPDPSMKDIFYFATASLAAVLDGRANFVGVYRYDAKSAFWQRLYKTTYPNEDGGTKLLRVIGLYDGRLILLEDFVDDSPGPCASAFTLAEDRQDVRLLSLDLGRPLDGLSAYQPPTTLLEAERARENACAQGL